MGSQKRINYKSEFDRLQGARKLSGLDPHVKTRMQELQKSKTITKWFTISSHLFYQVLINISFYNI